MATYQYTRDLINGGYNINNPLRVDGEGNPIRLSQEIKEVPEFVHKFNVKMNGEACDIVFAFDLSAPQKIQLDTIVSNHKNNT